MALSIRHKSIKALQGAFPRGTPFDSEQLGDLGVSSALAHHYLKSDWLARLGRGVFMFPNATLRREDSLSFLSRHVEGLHVGGKTALAWRGIRHNLPAREPISLWGEGKAVLPLWFTERFPARYTARNLFSPRLPKGFGLQPLPETPDGVLVSEPERALLEMLAEVGVHQGIEEARNIMEGIRSLRTDTLATLLKHCQRVKARLLCVRWAEELNLPWASAVRAGAGTRRGQSRWTARLKNGTILNLKP
jgi:hypothetical protein